MSIDQEDEGLFLAKREAQLMWHLIKGESLEVVADRYHLSLITVHYYLQSLYMKLVSFDTAPELEEESVMYDFGEN